MKGYDCPYCKAELHFEQIQGIRVCIEIGKKKVFNVFCPKCNFYFNIDEYNKPVNKGD